MKKLIAIAIFCFAFKCVFAQQEQHSSFFSVGVELGLGTRPGVYAQSYAAIKKGRMYYKIKNSSAQEIELFGDKPNPKLFDYALMVGKNFDVGNFHNFQLGAGLAFTGKVTQGKYLRSGGQENSGILLFGHSVYEKIQKNTIGLPLEAKYNFQLSNIIAFSLSANANINTIQSFAGLSVGTFIGKIR